MDFRQCNNEWSGSCSTPATEKPHWAKSSAIGREEPGAGNLANASSDAENASLAKCRIDLPKPHFAEQHRSARRPDNVRHPRVQGELLERMMLPLPIEWNGVPIGRGTPLSGLDSRRHRTIGYTSHLELKFISLLFSLLSI
jgi:hypothetical protein